MGFSDIFFSLGVFLFLDRKHRDPNAISYIHFPSNRILAYKSKNDLPPLAPFHVRIVVVSDTHNRHNCLDSLPECDIFIHCGDILMTSRLFSIADSIEKLKKFNIWLRLIPAKVKIVIAGNHDNAIETLGRHEVVKLLSACCYLQNEKVQYKSLSLWASPISHGKSPNKAFQSKACIQETLSIVPDKVDILITHGHHEAILQKVDYDLHLCGHNHNSYGISTKEKSSYFNNKEGDKSSIVKYKTVTSVCAPICDGKYRLRHLPIVIDYPCEEINYGDEREAVPHKELLNMSEDNDTISSIVINKPNYRYKGLFRCFGLIGSINQIRPGN